MRTLAIFAGGFSLGIFLALYLLPEGAWLPCGAVALLFAVLSLLLPQHWRRRSVLLFCALAIGFGYNWLYARQMQRPMEQLADTQQTVTMTLCDYAVTTDYGAKVTVQVDGLPAKAVYYGEKILLELQPGQTVTDTVYFQSAARIRDTELTTFTSKGVFLLAYNRGDAVIFNGTKASLHWLSKHCGNAIKEQIRLLFDEETAGFLMSILTGDRTLLSEQAGNDLSESGIYHITAVSGMHCGFLVIAVAFLVGRHRRRMLAACAIPLLVFYAFLTGGSPSVVRACVMLTLLLAAPLFRRENDGATSLLTALMLILLHNPFAAASVGLQLSFGAMAGLLWLTPKLYACLSGGKRRGKVLSFVVGSFAATMGALVFTVPLSAYYFGFVVLIAPLSNLLCLWVTGVIFVTGLAVVGLGFVWPGAAALAAFLPELCTRYVLHVTHLLAKVPHHALYTDNPYLKYWLIFVYVLFALAYLCGKGRRKYAVAAVCALLSLAVTIHLGAADYDARLETVILDVGQGQSIVLTSDDTCALVDCGSANSWYGAGSEAADRLLTMGHRKLDYLVLTHYDSDHVNGVTGLLSRMKVKTVLLPSAEDEDGLKTQILAAAEKHGAEVRLINKVEVLPLGSAELTVFPPVRADGEDNEHGLSVLAVLDERELLITGDMDTPTEKILLQTYELPDIEVLVAGHHGSKNATSAALLDALKPETVCISAGENNYGHPADAMLRRLAERACSVYRTDLHGNIRISWN